MQLFLVDLFSARALPRRSPMKYNKNKLRSFESSEHINEKMDGPYRGFDYKSLFSDPLDLAKWSQR